MGKFKLEFDTGNDEFVNIEGVTDVHAVARHLRNEASRIEDGTTKGIIVDWSGNKIGSFSLTGGPRWASGSTPRKKRATKANARPKARKPAKRSRY